MSTFNYSPYNHQRLEELLFMRSVDRFKAYCNASQARYFTVQNTANGLQWGEVFVRKVVNYLRQYGIVEWYDSRTAYRTVYAYESLDFNQAINQTHFRFI